MTDWWITTYDTSAIGQEYLEACVVLSVIFLFPQISRKYYTFLRDHFVRRFYICSQFIITKKKTRAEIVQTHTVTHRTLKQLNDIRRFLFINNFMKFDRRWVQLKK